MFMRISAIVLLLAMATLACGFQINIPQSPTPGPEVSEDINIPVPSGSGTPVLELGFGVGELNLKAGGEGLVSGTATYNVPAFKPQVQTEGSLVRLKQGNMEGLNTLPSQVKNTWDLKLGSQPMELQVNAGAYQARFELGGLALTNLTVKDGASDVKIKFSEPNKASMSLLRYETGASNVSIEGIGNASPASVIFKCGAGNYTLDFSGKLAQNLTAHIEAGLGNVTLVVPEGVPAQVTVTKGLSNVNTGSGWQQNGDTYTQDGSGPAITILVDIGAGNLTLSNK
jgi:hypothetical protein